MASKKTLIISEIQLQKRRRIEVRDFGKFVWHGEH